MQHDRRRDDRPGQAASAHFVDAGHVHEPDAAQRILERAHRGNTGHKTQNRKLRRQNQKDRRALFSGFKF
jgi:hypothetical protein